MGRLSATLSGSRALDPAPFYRSSYGRNFLRDWRDGNYPAGEEQKPVTWVSLEDARAYARWAGKRLPNEWEWQYAAQGVDGRLYPWGSQWDASAVPTPDRGRTLRGSDNVNAHPGGASPFGVMDMVGNVWQWTNEFEDTHTRTEVLGAAATIIPKARCGTFPKPIGWMNTANTC